MIDFVQTALSYVIPAFLVLTLVVTVHEFGHFLAARACGVKVDRFSIGFGRAIFHHVDRHGVDWRLGWIPLGGYVRFAGDESSASVPDHEDLKHLRAEVVAKEGQAGLSQYFHFKPVSQRMIVVAAGPAANFLLAIGLFALLFMWVGQPVSQARVATVNAESPAAAAGLRPGDALLQVNGRPLRDVREFQQVIALRADLPTSVVVERDGQEVLLNVVPEPARVKDELGVYNVIGTIGIAMDTSGRRFVRLGPVEAVGAGVERTWDVLTTTVSYLSRLIRGEVPADQIGGPLRVGHTAGGIAQLSLADGGTLGEKAFSVTVNLLMLAGLLSVSIGFMNLLPVPVLDGGHLLFYGYEALARRPLAARVQDVGYRLGLALLLGFMLFATWNDFQNLRVFQLFGRLVS